MHLLTGGAVVLHLLPLDTLRTASHSWTMVQLVVLLGAPATLNQSFYWLQFCCSPGFNTFTIFNHSVKVEIFPSADVFCHGLFNTEGPTTSHCIYVVFSQIMLSSHPQGSA